MSGTVLVVGDSSKRNLYLVGISLHTVLSFVCLKEWLFLDIARFFGNRQEVHLSPMIFIFLLLDTRLVKSEELGSFLGLDKFLWIGCIQNKD